MCLFIPGIVAIYKFHACLSVSSNNNTWADNSSRMSSWLLHARSRITHSYKIKYKSQAGVNHDLPWGVETSREILGKHFAVPDCKGSNTDRPQIQKYVVLPTKFSSSSSHCCSVEHGLQHKSESLAIFRLLNIQPPAIAKTLQSNTCGIHTNFGFNTCS